jgi:hypothetical protein
MLRAPVCAASRLLPRHAQKPQMISLPFGNSGSSGKSSGPSEDVLMAYRLMGLDLDATYDEIERSYDELMVDYAKDPKRKIKLQVAKDKILEDRLRQRMSGSSSFSAVVDPFARKDGPKPLITIPPALQGIMEVPDKEVALKNLAVFGLIGCLPAVTVTWLSTSFGIGFAVSLYLLYNRGVPDQGEMGAEMRPPKPKPLLMATGISLLLGCIGASLGVLILANILTFLSQELLIGLGSAFGFFTAASLFKVQDDYI